MADTKYNQRKYSDLREINRNLLIIMAAINAFYLLSYNIRNAISEYIFEAQVLGLNYYEKSQYTNDAIAYSITAIIVLLGTIIKKSPRENSITRFENKYSDANTSIKSIRDALFILCVISLMIFYTISGRQYLSYEELHKITKENIILSKLLYTIIIYLGFELGILIANYDSRGTISRFFILSILIIITTGMRSFIVMHIMILIAQSKIGVKKILAITPLIILALILVAMLRSEEKISLENGIVHLTMFMAGAASQVDLFYIGKTYNIGPREVDIYFEENLSSYFESGGGLGAFLPLELSEYMPKNTAMLIAILSPIFFYRIIDKAKKSTTQLIMMSFLIQYPIIIRNPIPSWINGFAVFTFFIIYGYTKNSYRRPNI